MADICMCQDKRCPSRTVCYRFTAERDKYRQAFFSKSPRKPHAMSCDEFWSNEGTPDPTDYSIQSNVHKRKVISMKEYNQKMAEIIKMGKPVTDTLVDMLEEAAKYKITQPALRKKCNCNTFGMSHKHNKFCDIYAEKVCKKQPKVCKCNAMGMQHPRGKICEDYLKQMDAIGIESQKHILKEWDKKRRKK